jgi:general secretion pathway protein F
MTSLAGSRLSLITLDDLAALNREMAALAAAGLPLEAGLRQVAREFSHSTGRLAEELAADMSAGKSLAEAIAAHGERFPSVYRAVVEAGLHSGRLASALEGYAETAARTASLRRIVGQAIVYPLIVVIIAWELLMFAAIKLMPSYQELAPSSVPWLSRLGLSADMAATLSVAAPAALITTAVVWWVLSGEAAGRGSWMARLRWMPGARRTARLGAYASFADLLRLLLEVGVPMNEALPLAGDASNDSRLAATAREAAQRVAEGQPLHKQTDLLRRFPPLVRTVLLAESSERRLLAGLKRAAAIYRDRAAGWLVDMAVMLPVGLTLLLAIGVVGVYGLLILQPYFTMLHELAHWGWH